MAGKQLYVIWFNMWHKIKAEKENYKMKYVCDVCGWIYDEAAGDEELGIAPGTKFGDLPEDFLCPLCMVGTELFSEVKDE